MNPLSAPQTALPLVERQQAPRALAKGPAVALTPEQKEAERIRGVALDFEEVLVKQMLAPLAESMSKAQGAGAEQASPMVGSMVLDSLSRSIRDGGGLGFAEVIEEALRGRSPSAVPGAGGTPGAPAGAPQKAIEK